MRRIVLAVALSLFAVGAPVGAMAQSNLRIGLGDDGDGMVRSSIALSDGNLFIRTATELFCVGK